MHAKGEILYEENHWNFAGARDGAGPYILHGLWVYLYAVENVESGAIKPGGHYVAFNCDSDEKQFQFYNGEPRIQAGGYGDLSAHYLTNDILRFSM